MATRYRVRNRFLEGRAGEGGYDGGGSREGGGDLEGGGGRSRAGSAGTPRVDSTPRTTTYAPPPPGAGSPGAYAYTPVPPGNMGYPVGPGSDARTDDTRNRFIQAGSVNPLDVAGAAQGFLGQAASGYAELLMPELQRGLRATRSRFGAGGIRSGGAQAGEELAFQRLFSDPLQNRIAQLATHSLDFGQSEAQRGVENARSLLGFDENRFFNRLRLDQDESQFSRSLGETQRQFNLSRRDRRRGGIGRFVGTLAGGVGGFLLGGPAGAYAGAQIGSGVG